MFAPSRPENSCTTYHKCIFVHCRRQSKSGDVAGLRTGAPPGLPLSLSTSNVQCILVRRLPDSVSSGDMSIRTSVAEIEYADVGVVDAARTVDNDCCLTEAGYRKLRSEIFPSCHSELTPKLRSFDDVDSGPVA